MRRTKKGAEIESVKLTLPVIRGRDYIQGSDTAPITLVEYCDYECPCCGQAYLVTLATSQ